MTATLLEWRILDIVAPEIGEQHEAEQLAAEERRAERRTSLVTKRLGDGTTRITINLPDGVATRLHTYLEACTSPRHDGAGEGDRIPMDRKRGQAFCALLEAVDPKRLPAHGGDATTLLVTVALDELRKDLGTAELGPGEQLSAGEVRRLACIGQVIPAVLGGKSEVLDLGRSSRLFKPAQRKAMIIRDRECRAEGRTIPQPGAKPTTGADPGRKVAAPTSTMAYSSATGTTIEPTTPPTTAAECPTKTCGSAGGRRSELGCEDLTQVSRCDVRRRQPAASLTTRSRSSSHDGRSSMTPTT